ncbi:MAG TPA: RDD family protein [Xanthomonadales bacterium]|nr:RDD family protein [Xanthomonadales bacterium]
MNDAAPNPYNAPRSNVAMPDDASGFPDASRGRRFATWLIDYIMFLGLAAAIGVVVMLVFGEAGLSAIEQIPDLVFGILVIGVYYIFFEGLWARTPGKFLLGTEVVSESGGPPTLGQVVGRTLCRLIPFEAFTFFGERGLHDRIPKTRVVYIRGR